MDSGKAVKKDFSDVTIDDMLYSILKYKFIVIICVITGIATGIMAQLIFTGNNEIYYFAKATMIVTSKNSNSSDQTSSNDDYNPTPYDVSFAQSLVPSVTALAKSNYVLGLVIDKIGKTNLSPDMLNGPVSCNSIASTAFIEISITWPNEKESIEIVNALMDVLPQAIIEKLVIGGVLVVDYAAKAEPIDQSSPKYMFICTTAGVIAGLCAAIFLGILNQRIRSAEDINTFLQVDTIAEIPYCRKTKNINNLVSDPGVSIYYREASDVMSSVVLHNIKQKGMKTIYITSAVNDEGKTTVSINLALYLAKKGNKVILIDCDAQHNGILKQLGLNHNFYKLQDILNGEAAIEDALIYYNDNMRILHTDISDIPFDTEILSSFFNTLGECSDYIIIDTPPMGLVSEVLLLNTCVDGVLFVIKYDFADMGIIADSINSIKSSGANILGCVLNAQKKLVSNNYHSKKRYFKKYYRGYELHKEYANKTSPKQYVKTK